MQNLQIFSAGFVIIFVTAWPGDCERMKLEELQKAA
jgi:hypothetical protein